MTRVELDFAGRTVSGHLAVPPDGTGRGVLVVPAGAGTGAGLRALCDRLGEESFVALAPADPPAGAEELEAAIAFLLEHEMTWGERAGVLGFAAGGGLALWAAAVSERVAATVAFYPVMPPDAPPLWTVVSSVLAHFGTADETVTLDDAAALQTQLEEAGVPVSFEYYDGARHGFFDEARTADDREVAADREATADREAATDREAAADREAAERAWGRTIAFLHESLGDTPG